MILFSTAYFGNIAYFRELIKHPKVCIDAHEHFIKQTYRNRCEILTANGIHPLSVPVIKPNGSKSAMNTIEISENKDWRKDHWKAIESAYAASPFFEHYGSEVKELIYQDEANLLTFNKSITERVLEWMGYHVEFTLSNEYVVVPETDDLRIQLNKKVDFNSSDFSKYIQVFDSNQFYSNLSILDLIFAEGPLARRFV